jgi:hypothetical protein
MTRLYCAVGLGVGLFVFLMAEGARQQKAVRTDLHALPLRLAYGSIGAHGVQGPKVGL